MNPTLQHSTIDTTKKSSLTADFLDADEIASRFLDSGVWQHLKNKLSTLKHSITNNEEFKIKQKNIIHDMFVHKDEKQKDGFELQSYVSKNEDGSLTQKKYLNYSENIDSDSEIEEFVIDATNMDQENIWSIIWSIIHKMWEELELEEFKKFEDEKIVIQHTDQELLTLQEQILKDSAPSGLFGRISEILGRNTKKWFLWTIANVIAAFGDSQQSSEVDRTTWKAKMDAEKSWLEQKFPEINKILDLFTDNETPPAI